MREKLIDVFCAVLGVSEDHKTDEAYQFIDDLIDNGVTIQKWIPVTERLPEVGNDVLMYFKKEGGTIVSGYFAYMDKDCPVWCAYTDGGWYTDCENKPTHWMPLPEPPKGE